MSRIRTCRHCEDTFNLDSPQKKRVGGYVNECPSCVEERGGDSTIPYLGVAAGNGKMSDVTILSFNNASSREAFHKMWQVNTGYFKGKSCQLGRGLVPTEGMKFNQVAENISNQNHKGKM